MLKTLVLLCAMAAPTGVAMAADAVPRAAPRETTAPPHWTGAYVGLNAGAAVGSGRGRPLPGPGGSSANGAPVRDVPPSMSAR